MSLRDPIEDPFCQPEDLGCAIPDSPHAVSVCLPCWEDVIGYEEADSRVIDQLELGYPRFVAHPCVADLFLAAQAEFRSNRAQGDSALVFPSLSAAWRAADYVKRQCGIGARIESYGWGELTALLVPESAYETAWKYWQHSGEIVSSRLAESALTDVPLDPEIVAAGEVALKTLRARIAALYTDANPEDVYLFSSGMGAISALHRRLAARHPGLRSAQVEFPYLDTMRVQELFGPGVLDLTATASGGYEELHACFSTGEKLAAVFTEVPSNPLLHTADLAAMKSLLAEHEVPLVIDDTIATPVNIDTFRFADAAVMSLTKLFSGVGDVAAGAVVLNPASPYAESLRAGLSSDEAASPLFARDAIVLEHNSRHFAERVKATNENALELVDWLALRPEIARLWHPSRVYRERYDVIRRSDGGYGGLFSLDLHGGETAAAAFYDALALSKGPSLGTNFSLVSPYTLLVHYKTMDWAIQRGVPRTLIRLSVGLEELDDLQERLEEAFKAL